MQYQYLLYSYYHKYNSVPRHSRRPVGGGSTMYNVGYLFE